MRTEMARIMEIDIARVGIKATRPKKLGFNDREERIPLIPKATLVKT